MRFVRPLCGVSQLGGPVASRMAVCHVPMYVFDQNISENFVVHPTRRVQLYLNSLGPVSSCLAGPRGFSI